MLELLVVMGIMALMMSIGVAGYYGMRRGAEMRGASGVVQTTLMLARQQAVTKRHKVEVHFYQNGQTNSLQVVDLGLGSISNLVHGEVFLPPAIQFYGGAPTNIIFMPTGSANGSGTSIITLTEKMGGRKGPQKVTITVWNLTGITKVE